MGLGCAGEKAEETVKQATCMTSTVRSLILLLCMQDADKYAI